MDEIDVVRQARKFLSAVRKLMDNRSTRVDFDALDRLMRYFGTTDLDDILEYTPEPPR